MSVTWPIKVLKCDFCYIFSAEIGNKYLGKECVMSEINVNDINEK